MDRRALHRLALMSGLLITLAAVVAVRSIRVHDRMEEVALIGAIALGLFLAILGLMGMIQESPADEAALRAETDALPEPRLSVIAAAAGIFLFLCAIAMGALVGAVQSDLGAGLQTFTFSLILGGIVLGVGALLGYRPGEGV